MCRRPKASQAALEASLDRLDTDYIDVYYLHKDDVTTPLEETLRTLDEFLAEGSVTRTVLVGVDFGPGSSFDASLDELALLAESARNAGSMGGRGLTCGGLLWIAARAWFNKDSKDNEVNDRDAVSSSSALLGFPWHSANSQVPKFASVEATRQSARQMPIKSV